MIKKNYLIQRSSIGRFHKNFTNDFSVLGKRFANSSIVTKSKFTTTNRSYRVVSDIVKEKIEYITNTKPQIVEIAKNVLIEKVVTKPIIQTVENKIVNTLTNTQKVIQLQDRFVTTNQTFIRNRDIVKEKIEYITNSKPQIVEIAKNVLVERVIERPIIKTLYYDRVFTLSKIVEVEKNIYQKEIIEKPVIQTIKESVVQRVPKIVEVQKSILVEKVVEKPIIKTIENTIVKKVPQIVEVQNNILVERVVERPVIQKVDHFITQQITKVVEVAKNILVEKVVEKPVIKTVENTIIKSVPQIVEVQNNILVERVVERPVIQKVDHFITQQITKVVEVAKNILVEKVVEKPIIKTIENTIIKSVPQVVEVQKVVEKPVPKIVEVVAPAKRDKRTSVDVTSGNREINFSFPKLPTRSKGRMEKAQTHEESTQVKHPTVINEVIEAPKVPTIEKIEPTVIQENIINYIQSGDIDIDVILPDINGLIEGMLLQKLMSLGSSSTYVSFDSCENDIDRLATKIFRQLKDELDIEYRRL
jgi:hypothetical protein